MIKNIQYLGVENPQTLEEIAVEIAGLEHAAKQAEEQIARLRQAVAVFNLQSRKHDGLQKESGTEEKDH